jgi:hypothetical protein
VNAGYQLIGIRSDDRKGSNPFARSRVFPLIVEPIELATDAA